MFAWIVDKNNSNTNKSTFFFDENDDGNNNQCDESPSSKERKTEMNPSSKKSAFYSLLFLSLSLSFSFSLSCSFSSSLLGVCRCNSTIKRFSSLVLLFLLLHTATFCCVYAPAFYYNSAIRPTNQLFPLQHTFSTIIEKKRKRRRRRRRRRKKTRRKEKKKNTSKELSVRAISRLKMSSL